MIKETSEILQHYIRAVNIIDDYFEYRYLLHTQGENREYVLKILDGLTKELEEINNENKQNVENNNK